MNDFYVYAWIRPDTGAVFYIGKGRNKRDSQMKDHNPIFVRIVKKLGRAGLTPFVTRIHENLTELQAFALERSEIARHGRINRRTGTLANLTDGGEGASGTVVGDATRLLVGAASTARWADDSYRDKLASIHRTRFEDQLERDRNAANTAASWCDPVVRDARTEGVRRARGSEQSRRKTSEASRSASPSSANKSGFKGVFFSKVSSAWTSQIKLLGKSKHLGIFPTPEEAAHAYDRAALAAWGSDCYLNFPADIAA